MQFINLTPHAVSVYARVDCIKQPGGRGFTLKAGAQPRAVFSPSGTVARAAQQQEELPSVVAEGYTIPVWRMVYGEPVDLPERQEGVALIVSALTANAAVASGRNTDDLYIVQGVVRTESVEVVGCTGFAQI